MSDYEKQLENQIEELRQKLAIYEEVAEHLLPFACKANAHFESNEAWLKAIKPTLERVMQDSDLTYHQRLIDATSSFAHTAENEYVELSRKIHKALYGEKSAPKIWHKRSNGIPGIFIDRDDPRTGYENTK